MTKFLCKSQSKEISQPTCLGFRRSSESSRTQDRNRDVDTEARRKAAAWAWHERAGGEVIPTRPRGVEKPAAVSRLSRVDRSTSLLNDEAKRDTGAHEISSEPTNGSGTSLFDASELSSLAQQIDLFAQKLQGESATENCRMQIGDPDKSIHRALDQPSTSDQQASEKGFTRHRRSFSDPTAPRQFLYETCGVPGTERKVGHSDCRMASGLSQTSFENVQSSKKSSLRKSLFLIQKLCRKISKGIEGPYSDLTTRVQSHHHYHHHYHYYSYHTDPDEELQILERAKGRRHSESFTQYTERGLADYETQRNAAVIASKYWASAGDRVAAARGGTADIHDYDRHFSPDDSLRSPANISKDCEPTNVDRYRDKAHGSAQLEAPRIRRHSAEIGPSFHSWERHA